MLIEYLYRKSIGASGGGGEDLHKNPKIIYSHKNISIPLKQVTE